MVTGSGRSVFWKNAIQSQKKSRACWQTQKNKNDINKTCGKIILKTNRKDIAYVKIILPQATDNGEWGMIGVHLPRAKNTGCPPLDSQTVFDDHKFRKWCDEGVFEKILRSLVDNCLKFYLVERESTFCKVHRHAAGVRKFMKIKISACLYSTRQILLNFTTLTKSFARLETSLNVFLQNSKNF